MTGTDNQGAPVRAGTDSYQHARAELMARRAKDLAPKAAPPARVVADGASTDDGHGVAGEPRTLARSHETPVAGSSAELGTAPADTERTSCGATRREPEASSTGFHQLPQGGPARLTIDFAPLELEWRAELGAAVIVGEATGLWHGASLSAFSGAHGVTL